MPFLPKPPNLPQRALEDSMVRCGIGLEEIARLTGRRYSTIYNKFRLRGWKMMLLNPDEQKLIGVARSAVRDRDVLRVNDAKRRAGVAVTEPDPVPSTETTGMSTEIKGVGHTVKPLTEKQREILRSLLDAHKKAGSASRL